MTRKGPSRPVDATFAFGRLRKALAYHEVARLAFAYLDRVRDADAVASNAVLAAIAYTDAITAACGGRVNQKDHIASVSLLRDTLGKALPEAQERRLIRLLGRKDEIQYGARTGRMEDASQVITNLDEFSEWAKTVLLSRGVSVTD
jgi:hypothetical protein